MLQVRYGALLSKADPHCAVALLGEVPPWGVMLRLGDHACCQLLCNVRAELARSIPDQRRLTKDVRAPPHQGRPREKRDGGEQSSNELSSGSPTGSTPGSKAGRARARKPYNWMFLLQFDTSLSASRECCTPSHAVVLFAFGGLHVDLHLHPFQAV